MEEKPNILLVEDEFIIANDIQESLEQMGYRVCGMAASGNRAIELTEEYRPDLVLMDIMLKGEMDGIETADVIRTEYGTSVIYLSAYSDEKILARAKSTLPFGYLIKPFKDRELRAAIEMALYKKKIDREKDKLINKLQEALDQVKFLTVLLPICCRCKKIKDDDGYWNAVENYIQARTKATFTHGICPACAKELYGDQVWYNDIEKDQ